VNAMTRWLRRVNNRRIRSSGGVSRVSFGERVLHMRKLRTRGKSVIFVVHDIEGGCLARLIISWRRWLKLIRVYNLWKFTGIDGTTEGE
jgi:hypothetical protein